MMAGYCQRVRYPRSMNLSILPGLWRLIWRNISWLKSVQRWLIPQKQFLLSLILFREQLIRLSQRFVIIMGRNVTGIFMMFMRDLPIRLFRIFVLRLQRDLAWNTIFCLIFTGSWMLGALALLLLWVLRIADSFEACRFVIEEIKTRTCLERTLYRRSQRLLPGHSPECWSPRWALAVVVDVEKETCGIEMILLVLFGWDGSNRMGINKTCSLWRPLLNIIRATILRMLVNKIIISGSVKIIPAFLIKWIIKDPPKQ